MFSLQRLIGGGDIFFDLLERSAAEAQESVHQLAKTALANNTPELAYHGQGLPPR